MISPAILKAAPRWQARSNFQTHSIAFPDGWRGSRPSNDKASHVPFGRREDRVLCGEVVEIKRRPRVDFVFLP